jgi:alpha-amylase
MNICFYFQVHQPYRLRKYRIFDIGNKSQYFITDENNLSNETIFKKVSKKCYLPVNKIFLDLLKKNPNFKISFSLSGVFLDQAGEFLPEVISSFQHLVSTGQVEILSETYYHSLSFLYSKEEFRKQIELHKRKIENLFGVTPKVFRNTELIYSDEVGKFIEDLGYKGILAEGADKILGWKSPNFLYKANGTKNLRLFLKNYKMSDDIAFRFSEKTWSEYPLTAGKYGQWVKSLEGNGDILNLFMDYETFGEHQWEDSGIFEFLKALPSELLKDNKFLTPSEAIEKLDTVSELSVPDFISWADTERDLSAWLSNPIQNDAIEKLYAIEKDILESENENLISDWRKLTTSDHFYYMCTKYFADGDVHKYFNPYESPYDAFITFMNVLNDIQLRLGENKKIKV